MESWYDLAFALEFISSFALLCRMFTTTGLLIVLQNFIFELNVHKKKKKKKQKQKQKYL